MTTLQKHIASQPITDPWPERRINAEAVLEARLTVLREKTQQRSTWRWLRAFLPMLLLIAAAEANTIFIDLTGNVMGKWDWPSDKVVIVVVPTVGGNMVNGTPRPAPTPGPTPRP